MSWIEALILGVIQGLTEFLPVSSSGHLTIGATLFGMNGEENLTFAVVVHAATVLSTIVVLWSEVSYLFKSFFSFRWNEGTSFVCKILLSMIPAVSIFVGFQNTIMQNVYAGGLKG